MKFMRKMLPLLLAVCLTAALLPVLAVPARADGTGWSVQYSNGNFVVSRTDTSAAVTVRYRVVSLSAIAGQHFTVVNGVSTGNGVPAVGGELSFAVNDTGSQSVRVTERTPGTEAYKYQTGSSRAYRFELLDADGFLLASCDRDTSTGLTQFIADKVSKSVSDLVTINSSGNFSSGMSSSKYLDVSFSLPSGYVETKDETLKGYVLIDDSYDYAQKPATVSTSTLITSTGASDSYLSTMGCKIYATVCFTEKERDDGYQYVQIVAGTASASYDGADPNGEVNDPVNSVYKVCFELSTGSDKGQGKAYFPHRGTGSGEFSLSDGKLWQQKYKSSTYNGSGAVVLPVTTSSITTRFDAAGNNDDTWGYKDFFVRMALCDSGAPTVTTSEIAVSAGPYNRGNTFYISIPFSEIVTVSGTPTLSTSWGTASYISGSGSNVLTFKGTISADAAANGKILSVNSISDSTKIKDLVGNTLSSAISKTFPSGVKAANPSYSITYDLGDGAAENPTSYTYDTAAFTLNNPTRTGYVFTGWTGSNGSTPELTVTVPQNSHGDLSYTANYVTEWSTLQELLNAGGTVTLDKDYTAMPEDCALTVPSNVTVTLDLNGHILNRGLTASADDGYVIKVAGNLTVTDSAPAAAHTPAVTYTDPVSNSTVTVTGGVITGGCSTGNGGGVFVNGGTFTQSGGTISGNTSYTSGGVHVNGGTFTLTGSGAVSGNNGSSGGGVFVNGGATFTLSGNGAVSGNNGGSGGGVFVDGGGTFTQSGGMISGNTSYTSGGVYVNGGAFTMEGGEVSGNKGSSGGGVYIAATASFTMGGGAVSGNTASGNGGGVYVNDGTLALSGDSAVSGNVAQYGGGVYMNRSEFIQSGGTVSDNEAEQSGGGVYAGTRSSFTLSGDGAVSNNSGRYGGGAFIASDASFTLSGGVISNNSASDNGGGVFTNSNMLRFSGSPAVTGNMKGTGEAAAASNVYLTSGKKITVSSTLTEQARIGVTLKDTAGVFTIGLPGRGGAANFTSDNSDFGVYVNEMEGGEAAVGTLYDVNIDGGITGGTVTASPARTGFGGLVTLTVTSDAGCETVSVSYNDGTDHVITPTNGVYSFRMPASSATVTASFETTWAAIQAALSAGRSVTLHNDVTAGPVDGALPVPLNVNVTLDLNGHILNRGLTASVADGYVIIVHGNLTVTDSAPNAAHTGSFAGVTGGVITGGCSTGNGGGVYVEYGTFTQSGGAVTGNTARYGGGVAVRGGIFILSGGEITGNTAGTIAGGVYIEADTSSIFQISGGPTVTGNTTGTGEGATANNIFLDSGKTITVSDSLAETARMGVTQFSTTGPFTSGLNGKGSAANFTSDNSAYGVYLRTADGEAAIGQLYTVTIAGGIQHGTVTAVPASTAAGETVTLTDAPDAGCGIVSASYSDGTGTYAITPTNGVWSFTMPGANVTVTAVLGTTWAGIQRTLNEGGSITLLNDVTAGETDAGLIVPQGKTATLDLNGHILSRGLTAAADDGYVIKVEGTLEVTDSAPDAAHDPAVTYTDPISNSPVTITGGVITGGSNSNNSNNSPGGGVCVVFGSFTLSGGAIAGNTSDNAGGVYVEQGSFTLSAGTIAGNSSRYCGGGVYVNRKGSFTQSGGTIAGNTSRYDGGGVYVNDTNTYARFEMTGGTISRNKSTGSGGGVSVTNSGASFTLSGSGAISYNSAGGSGGGVDVNGGSFTLEGNGAVSYNSAGASGGGVYVNGGTFTLSGNGAVSYNSAGKSGGGVYVEYGTFTMEDGGITGNTAADNGGGLCLIGSEFTMTKGGITGNTAKGGGGVYVYGGSVTMKGGAVSGNTAGTDGGGVCVSTGGSFTLEGSGEISHNTADGAGGGVWVYGNGFTMKGGAVSGNKARDGGGVFTSISTSFIQSGGAIVNNTATDFGGGVYVFHGSFTQSGGVVSGNKATVNGGGVYMDSSTVTLTGGEISNNNAGTGGGVYMDNVLKVSGSPAVIGNTEGTGDAVTASNVCLKTGKTITVSDSLTGTALLGVTLEDGTGVFTSGLSGKGGAANFTSDISACGVYLRAADGEAAIGNLYAVTIDSGILHGTVTANKENPAAGETVILTVTPDAGCEPVSVSYSDGTNSYAITPAEGVWSFIMPDANATVTATFATTWAGIQGMLTKGGSITMFNDVTAGAADAALTVPAGKTATLDLNGHILSRGLTASADDGYVINVEGTLEVTDSAPNAEHNPAVTYTDPVSNSTVTVKGGVITGGINSGFGGGVCVVFGSFTLSGGTVSGNEAQNGGGVCVVFGSFTLSGGAVSGNKASYDGGGVYLDKDTSFTQSGGAVSGNTARYYGGGVYMGRESAFSMTGGAVSGNTAGNSGGGVTVTINSTFTQSGGTVSGNTATDHGGGVYVDHAGFALSDNGKVSDNTAINGGGVYAYYGTFTMEDGSITDNAAGQYGGGVYVGYGTFTMEDGGISGSAASTGGGVYVGYQGSFTLEGGAVSDNEANTGGGVYVDNRASFTLKGSGAVSDNEANTGGGVCVTGGTFTMKGGSVTNNNTGNGGGVYVSSGAFIMESGTISGNGALDGGGVYMMSTSTSNPSAFTMKGGEITGNSAGCGGGVYVSGGAFTMQGGSVTNNNTGNGGGGVYVSSGAFIMESGTISGNGALDGGGVYVSGGTFTLTGGGITGNQAAGGGGVYVVSGGTFQIAGGPAVTGNTGSTGPQTNVHLGANKKINVTGALTDEASIGVTTNNNNTLAFTRGLPGNGGAASFFSDNSNYGVRLNDSGEAMLVWLYNVAIADGIANGTVTADVAQAAEGETVTLTVTPAAGYAIGTVSYRDSSDHGITPSEGVYSFTMPSRQVTVSATFTQTAPVFTSAALELGGVLNLRYYVTYPDGWDPAGDQVVFTVKGVSHTVNYDANRTDQTGLYFPCPVNAYQMADPITAVYYHGGEEAARTVYTVQDNLNSLKDHPNDLTRALVRATMDYGHYIQPYLSSANKWTLGEGKDHEIMAPYNGSIGEAGNDLASSYTHVWKTCNTAYVTQVIYALVLNDTTTLRLTVKLNAAYDGVTATVRGQETTPVNMGSNTWLITLPGIPANALGTPYTFTLSVGAEKVLDLDLSGLSYVNLVLQYGNPTSVERKAMAALYAYAEAAKAYDGK